MDKVEKDKPLLLWLLIAIVVVVIVVAWYLIDCNIPSNEIRGQFGDKFGSVNALFSGLAFAGLIYTIVLQRKDLQLQKKDLELTRKELEGQKEEAKKQNKTLLKREFNTTYFNFLTANRNIANEIKWGHRTGQEYIEYIHLILSSRNTTYSTFSKDDYLSVYKEHRRNLSYYFKNLHNLIYFVNNSMELDSNEKKVYLSFLMNQISDYEIILFFYDNIYRNSDEIIKTLIEHYSLFYKFPYDLLICENDKILYKESAYGI